MRLSFAVACLAACTSDPISAGRLDAAPAADATAQAPDARAAAPDAAPDEPDAAADDAAVPLPYSITAIDGLRISSDGSAPNFHRVSGDVDFSPGPFAAVTMIVDLETTCYPFETWTTNPPPMGQRWPADCDAFDRNFEVTLDPPRAPGDAPGVELLRAITPFGGPMHIEVDVTDFANGLRRPHSLEVTIPTYSDGAGQVSGSNGGWNVRVVFAITPGAAPRNVLAVVPLVNFTHGSDTGTTAYAVHVPPGTVDSRIEYRVTGHGGPNAGPGCNGPAEEFCRRRHFVLVDGVVEDQIDPWREDCATLCTVTHSAFLNIDYCLQNPCGDMRSVRASRANWCPGSVTPPFVFRFGSLAQPGDHTFEYTIDRVAPGGIWRVSATYFAFGP